MKSLVLFSISTMPDSHLGDIASNWLVQFEDQEYREVVRNYALNYNWCIAYSNADYLDPLFRTFNGPITMNLDEIILRTLIVSARLSISNLIEWFEDEFPERFIIRINATYTVRESNVTAKDIATFKKYSVPQPGRIATFPTPTGRITRK
jgi:hypothetical protein